MNICGFWLSMWSTRHHCFLPAVCGLLLPKHFFFSAAFCPAERLLFSPQHSAGSHFQTADLPECPPQNQINISPKQLWSFAHLKGILFYTRQAGGKWILYCVLFHFVYLSPAEWMKTGQPQHSSLSTTSCCRPSSSSPTSSLKLSHCLLLLLLLSLRQVLCIPGRARQRRAAHRDD